MSIHKNRKTDGSRASLREAILSGHYLAGTYLPSARDLAKELKVSKSSVHNILKLLQEEGLIQIYPNCGALVRENTIHGNELKRIFVKPSDFGIFQYLPVTRALLAGASAGAEKKNCELVLSFSDSGRLTSDLIARHSQGDIQGVLYLQCQNYEELIVPLRKAGIPCVIGSDEHNHTEAVRIYIDHRAMVRKAIRQLIGNGHRKIGILTGPARTRIYSEALAGYRGAMAEENLPYAEEWLHTGLSYHKTADPVKELTEYLRKENRPSAIFTMRDYRAEWLYAAASELHLNIPGDLSVLSFDNHSWNGAEASGLSSYEEPLCRQGELAVEMLRQWVRTKEEPQSVEILPELIERESIRKI